MGGRDFTSPRSNLDRGSLDERRGFNEPKGYQFLIQSVDLTMDR
jgi:hypothetical protein